MQHLLDHHGISEPWVNHVTDEKIGPPRSIEELYHFPERKGWCIDHKNFRLRVLPILPGASQSGTSKKEFEPKLRRFLQAWLFFGLIFTVVQKNNEPLMEYRDLAKMKYGYITTEKLRGKLDEWVAWEIDERPPGQRLRMIRLEAVLQFARRVVQTNLACSDAKTPPPGYSIEGDDLLYVPEPVILSIMVLGETLHDVKTKIAEKTGMKMRGWKNEDDSGWGPPRWVLKEMEDKKLCPRTIRLLRGQLRSNATLLLAAWHSTLNLGSSTSAVADHSKCSASICLVTPETKPGVYSQQHCEKFCSNKSSPGTCKQSSEAVKRGIMDMIASDENKRPLLQFKNTPGGSLDSLEPEVVEWQSSMEYATISHVWTDGFGNPDANTMLLCQLKLIRDLLRKLKPNSTSTTIPFWMDTLMIPVGSDEDVKDVRRKTIRQIPNIFKDASHTIVLDWALHGTDPDAEKPAQTAMRIIASGWMRRLWTLQEAFVSKSLHISQGRDAETLHYLDDLYKDLEDKTDGLTSTLITTVKNQLQSHVMHKQKKTQRVSDPETGEVNERAQWSQREAAVLVVNAWKAVRWRATANELHETLALASLLDVEFKETLIEEAGLTQPEKINSEDMAATKARKKEKDRAMKEFWTSFDRKWRDAIPPGIIFLPGDRVQIPGFGWAPRTWLSAHEVDFPDPLSFVDSTAELYDPSAPSTNASGPFRRGLRVCFPGFLLFAERRNILLTPNAESRSFQFPVDQGLKEWYKVEATDDEVSTSFLETGNNKDKTLAIILSRSRPQEFPAEIGLLVQIYHKSDESIHMQTVYREREGGDNNSVETSIDEYTRPALHCEILHRVKVSRDTKLSRDYRNHAEGPLEGQESDSIVGGSEIAESYRVPGILLPGDGDSDICIGETLTSDQIWYVDGFAANWINAPPLEPGFVPSEPKDTIQPTKPTKRGGRIFRRLRPQNVTGARVGRTEGQQTEAESAQVTRRATQSEVLDTSAHQPGRAFRRYGTWATLKSLGSRKK